MISFGNNSVINIEKKYLRPCVWQLSTNPIITPDKFNKRTSEEIAADLSCAFDALVTLLFTKEYGVRPFSVSLSGITQLTEHVIIVDISRRSF